MIYATEKLCIWVEALYWSVMNVLLEKSPHLLGLVAARIS